jgi:hypothetical protein
MGNIVRRKLYRNVRKNNWFIVQGSSGMSWSSSIDRGTSTGLGGYYVTGVQKQNQVFVLDVSYMEDHCPFSEWTLNAMAQSFISSK